jgi:hypothetical protein
LQLRSRLITIGRLVHRLRNFLRHALTDGVVGDVRRVSAAQQFPQALNLDCFVAVLRPFRCLAATRRFSRAHACALGFLIWLVCQVIGWALSGFARD